MEKTEWVVLFGDCFESWIETLDEKTQDSVYMVIGLLQRYGPFLSRPYADTVKGSKYNNMKELRIQHSGRPIRAFFAFDPMRQAIVLCAGDKSNDKQFYERMIALADDEFTRYLSSLK